MKQVPAETDLAKRAGHLPVMFIPFSKVEREGDLLFVEGIGTSEAEDADREIIDFDSVCKALPDFMEWANLREMHQHLAAGTIESALPIPAEKRVMLRAKVVDPVAQRKVEEGVYKGFSIGGRKGAKTGNRVFVDRITEWSLVDRPANPECSLSMAKAMDAQPGSDESVEEGGLEVQSITCSKARFKSAGAAKAWARKNGFKTASVDETDNSYRLRQFDPSRCTKGSHRTFAVTDGVQAVVCKADTKEAGVKKLVRMSDLKKGMMEIHRVLDMMSELKFMRANAIMSEAMGSGKKGEVERMDGACKYFAELALESVQDEVAELLPQEQEEYEIVEDEVAEAAPAGGAVSSPAAGAPAQKDAQPPKPGMETIAPETAKEDTVKESVAKRGAKHSKKTLDAVAEMRRGMEAIATKINEIFGDAKQDPPKKGEAAADGEAEKDTSIHVDEGSHNGEGTVASEETETEGDKGEASDAEKEAAAAAARKAGAKAAGAAPDGTTAPGAGVKAPPMTVTVQKGSEVQKAIRALLSAGKVEEAEALQRVMIQKDTADAALNERLAKIESRAFGKSFGVAPGGDGTKGSDMGGRSDTDIAKRTKDAEEKGDARALLKMIHGGEIGGTVSYSKVGTNGGTR